MSTFQKATRRGQKARVCFAGPTGSGKTWTALIFAQVLGDRVAVIDTERQSASLYADEFTFDTVALDPPYSPERYIELIGAAETEGYDVIVVDSLSHAWAGTGGVLEMVDDISARSRARNSFAAWREATPHQNRLVDRLLQSSAHVIVTLRSKMAYAMDIDDKGRTQIRKVGLEPVQRQGLEYEFTLIADMDQEHKLVVSKSRCAPLADLVVQRPGVDLAQRLKMWLAAGDAPYLTKLEISELDGRLRSLPADLFTQAVTFAKLNLPSLTSGLFTVNNRETLLEFVEAIDVT